MKKASLKYIILAQLVFYALVIHSQEKQKTEASADLVEYTNREGLPSTNISKIAQTKDGFIWISGIEGTYRFNGYEFEEVGAEFDLPAMQNMHYDSVGEVLYFASPHKFIRMDGNNVRVFTEKEGYRINGLEGQEITFLEADSKGRLWIGTVLQWVDKKNNGGLTKFENGEFTVYDSTNFPLDNAMGFIETPYGDLIFTSFGRNTQTREGSYVALYKDGKFQKIDESLGVSLQGANVFNKNLVNSVDKAGNTWLAFPGFRNSGNSQTNSGLLMYDGTEFHQYTDLAKIIGKDHFPVEVYYSLVMDKLYLTTFSLKTEAFNGKNKTIFEYDKGEWKPSGILEEIYPLKDLKSGVVINDFQFNGAFFQNGNKYIPEVLVMPSANSSRSSPYPDQLFHFTNGKWEKFDAFNGSNGFEIKNGVLNPNTRGFGIYYPNASRMLTEKDGLLRNNSFIPIMYTDRKGIVWISFSYTELPAYAGIAASGINVWDGKKLWGFTEEDGLASNITFATFQDSKDRIWITTSKGITMVREITNSKGEHIFKLINIADSEGKPYNTSNMLETESGDIYAWENYVRPAYNDLNKANYYLGKLEGDTFVKIESPFREEDKTRRYQVFDLQEDNNGRLWFTGHFSDDLKGITSTPSRIMIYNGKAWGDPPQSWNVPSDQLHYVGKLEGGMYFLTVGGFYLFNGDRFIDLSDSVNVNADFRILKGASVTGTLTNIQVDDKLYIRLRRKGLVIFDGTHLDFYTKKEGLPTANISNPVTDAFRGNVYFSSPLGAIKIHGNNFQTFYNDENIANGGPNISAMDGFGNMLELYDGIGLYINEIAEKSYPLIISSVSIEDNLHYFKFPQKVIYSQNSFLFTFAALNFKDPKQTTYEHYLEGYDKDWSRPSPLAFAEYQNLPFGEYTFRVRGITSNGVKTNEASYSFIISPPFWRTWWAYVIYGMIFILGVFAVDRTQRRRLLERERKLISEKELAQAKEIEKAYKELKNTQTQLIQSEKMASLGELMAGIAHEIQNPLNFVNNFSEVSSELMDEIEVELEKGEIAEAKNLSSDIKRNLDKITYHGKRADAIVKGMLQHSFKQNGQKEPTDINLLADEYLRLSYHGLKAKDKSFNTTILRDFDASLPKVEVIPQDIGRVLLNLINNAFYAVSAKALTKQNNPGLTSQMDLEYQPSVTVSTGKLNNLIVIRVIDNGDGIPDDIREKIFQPFFTTKPAGQGTGLGLSLSYDIVNKGHGGELNVESKEGEGTVFTIHLPL